METWAGHGNKRQRSLPPLTHPHPGFSLVCRSQGEGWQVSRKKKNNFHHRLHLLGSPGSREVKKIRVTLIFFLTHSIIFKHSKAIEKRNIRGEGAYKKHVDYLETKPLRGCLEAVGWPQGSLMDLLHTFILGIRISSEAVSVAFPEPTK